jgi:hypothetical protein
MSPPTDVGVVSVTGGSVGLNGQERPKSLQDLKPNKAYASSRRAT